MADPKQSPKRSPLLDYSDASERLHPGLGEAPQPDLDGTPLTGPLSGWADQIAQDLEEQAERKAAAEAVVLLSAAGVAARGRGVAV